jgi:hypothetical protein
LVEAAKAVAVVAAADETLVAVLVVSKRSRWDLVFHVYPEGSQCLADRQRVYLHLQRR